MNEPPDRTAGCTLRPGLLGSLLIALATLTTAAAAEVAGSDQAAEQRLRIAAQRAQVEATWRARRADCADRFAVTSCIEAAEARHRQQIDALDRELDVLDIGQRRQRAEERLEIIRRKTEAVAAASEAGSAARAPEPLPPVDGPAAGAQESPPSSAEREIERRRAEAAREATARAAAARQRRIEAERRRVEREQRRAGGRAGAAPLPVPPSMPPAAASAPAR